jgi:hypothetical protein
MVKKKGDKALDTNYMSGKFAIYDSRPNNMAGQVGITI